MTGGSAEGAPVGRALCSSCGSPLSGGERFCSSCGVPLAGKVSAGATAARRPLVLAVLGVVALVAIAGVATIVWSANREGDSTSPNVSQVSVLVQGRDEGETLTPEQVQGAAAKVQDRLDTLTNVNATVTPDAQAQPPRLRITSPTATPQDLSTAVERVIRSATVTLRPVFDVSSPVGTADSESFPADSTSPYVQASADDTEFRDALSLLDCTNQDRWPDNPADNPTLWLGTCDTDGLSKYALEPATLDASSVTSAVHQLPAQGVGGWVVEIQFNSEGADALSSLSRELVGLSECAPQSPGPCNAVAITVNGVVISAPRFNEAINGGSVQIDGSFSAGEAQDLALLLDPLPARLSLDTTLQ